MWRDAIPYAWNTIAFCVGNEKSCQFLCLYLAWFPRADCFAAWMCCWSNASSEIMCASGLLKC